MRTDVRNAIRNVDVGQTGASGKSLFASVCHTVGEDDAGQLAVFGKCFAADRRYRKSIDGTRNAHVGNGFVVADIAGDLLRAGRQRDCIKPALMFQLGILFFGQRLDLSDSEAETGRAAVRHQPERKRGSTQRQRFPRKLPLDVFDIVRFCVCDRKRIAAAQRRLPRERHLQTKRAAVVGIRPFLALVARVGMRGFQNRRFILVNHSFRAERKAIFLGVTLRIRSRLAVNDKALAAFVEYIVADGRNAVRNVDAGQAGARTECLVANLRNTVRNVDAGQAGTFIKRFFVNVCHTIWNVDASQAGARTECPSANLRNAIRNIDAGQVAAARECRATDRRNAIRNVDTSQAAAVQKCIAADRRYRNPADGTRNAHVGNGFVVICEARDHQRTVRQGSCGKLAFVSRFSILFRPRVGIRTRGRVDGYFGAAIKRAVVDEGYARRKMHAGQRGATLEGG